MVLVEYVDLKCKLNTLLLYSFCWETIRNRQRVNDMLTPLLADKSVLTVLASFTVTVPSFTRMSSDWPFPVLSVTILRSEAITTPVMTR